MIYKLSINNKNSAGTVHSKCSSTGSACPVASGHRDSIQQEMLKERLSDLLGKPCVFASVACSQIAATRPLNCFCFCSRSSPANVDDLPFILQIYLGPKNHLRVVNSGFNLGHISID